MKFYKKTAILLLLLPYCVNLGAQYSFKLNEALDFALINNRNIIISQKKIETSKKRKWEVIAEGLPQIDGNIDYNLWLKQQLSLIPGAVLQQPEKDFVPIAFGTKHAANGSIRISQKIFDASHLVAMQSAKLYMENAKLGKEQTTVEIKKQVTIAYVNVLVANESINITKKNIKELEKHFREAQQLHKNGLSEEESVEQMEITLGELKNALLNLIHEEKIASGILNILLGIDLEEKLSLNDKLDEIIKSYERPIDQNFNYNINNNVKYRLEQAKIQLKKSELKLARSRSLPSISISNQSSLVGNGVNASKALHTPDMLSSNLLLINLRVPIFSSYKRGAAIQRKKLELIQAKVEFEENEEQLKLELNRAKDAFKLSLDNWKITKLNLKLSERIAHKNQVKFNNGLISSFDLRQAQIQLYKTQATYLQAIQTIVNRKAELESIINL